MHEDVLGRSKGCRGSDSHDISVMMMHDNQGASSLKADEKRALIVKTEFSIEKSYSNIRCQGIVLLKYFIQLGHSL